MAREVRITVTGDSGGYKAMVEKMRADNQRLFGDAQAGAAQTAVAFRTWESATGRLALKQRDLGGAVSLVASQVGGLNQVAGLASNAILAMATSSGATGIALGALATVLGLLMSRIEAARERFRELSEIELADLARQTKALTIENDIKRQLAVLKSATPEIEAVKQKYDELRNSAEKAGVRPQALAAIDQARALEIQKVQIEQAKKAAEAAKQEAQAIDQARKSLTDQADALNKQLIAMELGAEAADSFTVNQLLASEAVQKLGAEGVDSVRAIEALLAAQRRFNEEKERSAAVDKLLRESGAALDKQREEELGLIEKQLELRERLANLDLEKLRAGGASENEILQKRIDLLRQQRELLEQSTVARQPGQLAEISKQIEILELQQERLGEVTINVGREISRGVTDIFGGLISGTLKAADVGKSALAVVGRTATEFFADILNKKLGFENVIFSNLRGFHSNAAQAIAAGGGSNGIINTLLFGTGQLDPSSTFSLAGPGQGFSNILASGVQSGSAGSSNVGLFGLLGQLLQTPILPSIFTGATVGSVGGAGLGGFLFGNLVGLNKQGQIGSTLGGIGGSLIGALPSALGGTLGSTLGASAASATSGLLGAGAGALGSLVGTFAFPIIGTLIGAILGQVIGNLMKTNPTAVLKTAFSGVNFNELESAFDPGTISVTVRRTQDISRSKANQVAGEVQQFLTEATGRWVSLLNLFPDTVQREMLPALDTTNDLLNRFFGRLKFSEGGSRNIRQELDALRGQYGQSHVAGAILPTFNAGIAAALRTAGLQGSGANVNLGGISVENLEKLFGTLEQFAGLAGSLATVAPGGAATFLSRGDLASLNQQFGALGSISDPAQFIKTFEAVKEGVQPILDFLNASIQQTTQLLGRGLIAAVEAVTESQALAQFQGIFKTGIQDAVESGLVESLLATGELNTLLAPLQQLIRETVQSATASGIFDPVTFETQLAPIVEGILGQASVLNPVIEHVQNIGERLRQQLGLVNPEVQQISASLVASGELFGQSLISALNAAKDSSAKDAFFQTLNSGVRDALFNGMTQALIESASFQDFLAPLQDLVSRFTAHSIETGEFNVQAFRQQAGIIVGGINERTSQLGPLIEELGRLGIDIRSMLGVLEEPEPTAAPVAPQQVIINLNGVGQVDENALPSLARRINNLLEPVLPPRA